MACYIYQLNNISKTRFNAADHEVFNDNKYLISEDDLYSKQCNDDSTLDSILLVMITTKFSYSPFPASSLLDTVLKST